MLDKGELRGQGTGRESLHEVIVSSGFWVADTAVTQRLWQAVVGDTPSRFQGQGDRPVVQVSYNDAIFFLQCLNELFPEINARLLTEAEWEYCCRAGSATPFSFGTRITPEQVNYNGQHPYYTGRTGRNRKQSVPVNSLPCNDWGLFEMHGNVWEWCQDYWQPDLEPHPSVDPQGPKKGTYRVVRGGSWASDACFVRSACRDRYPPNYCFGSTGMRLAIHATM
ncbi:MAG: formylglycine-generating enzyme family protein [Candidatus Electrothrix sp. ATG2]|nr:formylglycine-generating enzyme family protein [Candidatus Electrothrix sp. ATG2]